MMAESKQRLTLAIDIGGTHIKASVLDARGEMAAPEMRRATPAHPAPPSVLGVIVSLAGELPAFDRISAGFPGFVRDGVVHTAPNLGTASWRDFALAQALAERLKKPARILNDADVQGLGVIDGKGLECVLTLGTGIGSALFLDGRLMPHIELGQHPIRKKKTYDEYLGDAVLKHKGRERWNRRLRRAIATVETLINYDMLHLGGGNARAIDFDLPAKVKLAANSGGITGGIRLWDAAFDDFFTGTPPKE
jgi:polyphosphate glucokinase